MDSNYFFPHLTIIKARNGYVVFTENQSESEKAVDATGVHQHMSTIMEQLQLRMTPEYIKQSAMASAEAFHDVENRDPVLENLRKGGEGTTGQTPTFTMPDLAALFNPKPKDPYLREDSNCYVFATHDELFDFLKSLILPKQN